MPRLLLADGEDLVLRFRPHAASFLGRFLVEALWIAYGAAAAWTATRVASHDWLAPLGFAGLGALHAGVAWFVRGPGRVTATVWAAAGLALLVGVVAPTPLRSVPSAGLAVGLGVVAAVWGWGQTEFLRRRNLTDVTNRRVVLRTGVTRRTERAVPFDRVEGFRSHEGALGQIFGYGTLDVVLTTKTRRRGVSTNVVEPLHGVPRVHEVRQELDILLAERKLSPRERQRRLEERRLRDSMQAVAGWVLRERA